jgi:predicted HTH transcriptional regulator
MPKIMASFANAAGGWIFIGVEDDGSYKGVSKPRTDFGQTLGQLAYRYITPFLRFNSRFVSRPGCDDGVLVVEVEEGIAPPYVSNGSVYVRIGSSSQKIQEADSYTIIDLNRKARRHLKEIDCFNCRTIYYPFDSDSDSTIPSDI